MSVSGTETAPIPFTRPFLKGSESAYVQEALAGALVGGGPFTHRVHSVLKEKLKTPVLLTHSCTAAMEMAGFLFDLKPGDEFICPSWTFVSTANAFVSRGAVPVFVDIRPDTLNIDETKIEEAITPRTRAIVVVHYAGVACAMDAVLDTARRHGLYVLEDAAQGVGCSWQGKPLGTLGDLGAYSFHGTKNIVSGEGGCLIVNRPDMLQDAEILWEKGTDRSRFLRGETDKYTWQSVGSSFLPSELTAALLLAQLESMDTILASRLAVWNAFHEGLAELEQEGFLQRPVVPRGCVHSGHIYALVLQNPATQEALRLFLKARGIQASAHYVPLHTSPMGQRLSQLRALPVTESIWNRLLRLPLFSGMRPEEVTRVIAAVHSFFRKAPAAS